MLEYIGKYNKGKILIDNVEENVVTQLYAILNNPAFADSNITIMPDCHIGSGVMAKLIIEKFYKLRIDKLEKVESIHNYIDLKNKIIRKGAISAQKINTKNQWKVFYNR